MFDDANVAPDGLTQGAIAPEEEGGWLYRVHIEIHTTGGLSMIHSAEIKELPLCHHHEASNTLPIH